MNKEQEKALIASVKSKSKYVALGFVAFLIALNCWTIVPANHEASVTSFGEVKEEVMEDGFHFVAPWWNIDQYSLQSDTHTFDNMGVASQDNFKTNMDASYTGSFVAGKASETRNSTGKASQYIKVHVEKTVQSCIVKAGGLQDNSRSFFKESVQKSMEEYIINCANTYLNSNKANGAYQLSQVRFSDINLHRTVQAFITKTKERNEAEQQQESALKIADLKAQEKTKKAEATDKSADFYASAKRKEADAAFYAAKQEAAGNKELSRSITPALVDYTKAKLWNGVLPTHSLGSNTAMFLK